MAKYPHYLSFPIPRNLANKFEQFDFRTPEQIRLRHQITEHPLCIRHSLEGARTLARQTSPAPFDGPKEAKLYLLHAYLAHGIRAVAHPFFAALQAT
ncbi:MAG: hypothetical protein DMG97_32615 [Acidobacteria bacterium]|nr:MAG: hypothetical protein DMG97_32615 [Acidobacteriota bacterium]PYV67976.1 MAG: hypothetical protein DMG96_37720 [Acidobacteriota bacterium]